MMMNTMDAGRSALNTVEATQKLKEILNVGQPSTSMGTEKVSSFINGERRLTNSKPLHDGDCLLEALTQQRITLQGSNESHSFGISADDVVVTMSPFSPLAGGSSRVQIRNIVDYGWEQKYYYGRLVAVHVSGTYCAYGIKAREKYAGVVRVMNRKTGDRNLLKGMTGLVKDLSFAHVADQAVLACVDEIGNLFVYKILEEDGKMNCTPILLVNQEINSKPSDHHRVIWCQYIPEDPSEDSDSPPPVDASKLLAVTHDDKVEMVNVDLVRKYHGKGPQSASSLGYGYQVITDYQQPIIDAAFSPDGAALATASLDGEVKFFQVYMPVERYSSRCLHQWKPHDGKPLSCLFFLDNHKNPNPEIQFWKFAITGADNNREIKVWSCESWNCLQVIRFEIPPGDEVEACMKAGLDASASYLLLSDITRKVLYILLVHQDTDQNMANICSIAEFPLSFPMLSYAIVDACRKKYKQLLDNEQMDDLEDGLDAGDDSDEDSHYVEGVVVRLLLIQPKSLQDCRIAFQPKSSVAFAPPSSMTSLSQDSIAFRDRLTDISFDTSICLEPDNSISLHEDLNGTRAGGVQPSTPSGIASAQLLLTPDAFTSPNHTTTPLTSSAANETPTSIPLPPITPSEEATLATPSPDVAPLATSESMEPELRRSGRSSGSSPSLEVQQILAPRKLSIEDDLIDFAAGDKPIEENETSAHSPISPSLVKDSSRHHAIPSPHRDEIVTVDHVEPSLPPMTNPILPSVPARLEYDGNLWPSPPSLPASHMTRRGSGQLITERKCPGPSDGAGDKEVANRVVAQDLVKMENRLETSLRNLEEMIQSLTQLHKSQQLELANIREDLVKYHSLLSTLQNFGHRFGNLEDSMSILLNKQLEQKRIEEILLNFDTKERQWQERIYPALSQVVTNAVNNRLDQVVKSEIRTNIIPMLVNFLEPMKEHLYTEVAQKLTSTDTMMRDNLSKLTKSKSTVDAIGSAAGNAIQGVVQSAYKESFQNHVVPAFEKACHNMFQQLNESFQRGTKEYIQHLETQADRRRRQSDQNREPVLAQLQSSSDALQQSIDHLNATFASSMQEEMAKQLHSCTARMQDVLLQNMQVLVKEELGRAMKEQQSLIGDSVMNAIRSRAVTPISVVDPHLQQAQIAQLVKQGQMNAAFQQALSAADLNLVVFVCESVPSEQVFSKSPCPLQQPVLLSLIQQLSADLDSETELKLKYLQDAVLNLDQTNPLTKEHVVTVVKSLRHKLRQFIQTHPTSEFTRVVKMLLLASQSVLADAN